MYYVAGQAQLVGPAPSRVVTAFGLAVGPQAVVVMIEPYCCMYKNPGFNPV
jgi:hypothetical protein